MVKRRQRIDLGEQRKCRTNKGFIVPRQNCRGTVGRLNWYFSATTFWEIKANTCPYQAVIGGRDVSNEHAGSLCSASQWAFRSIRIRNAAPKWADCSLCHASQWACWALWVHKRRLQTGRMHPSIPVFSVGQAQQRTHKSLSESIAADRPPLPLLPPGPVTDEILVIEARNQRW